MTREVNSKADQIRAGVAQKGTSSSSLDENEEFRSHGVPTELRVANLDCESDAAKIERGLRDAPGLLTVRVFHKSAKVALTYDASLTSPGALSRTLSALGFPARGIQDSSVPHLWRNPKVLTAGTSGILLLVAWLIDDVGASPVSGTVVTVTYIASLVVGGYYFGREAFRDLFFEREISIELLMTIAAVAATVMGAPAEGAMLAFLYSISEAAEGYTEEKTRSSVRALMKLAPKTALVRRRAPSGLLEVEIPVEEIVVGDVFVLRPGASVPTDGEIVIGTSSLNQAPVTGESVPVEKRAGEIVFAGTINGEGALEVRATKAFAENTIARIIQMVEEAQERKGKSERFIERFGKRYSPAVLAIGLIMAFIPPLAFGADWTIWISRATVFIVAAAPCALVISIPITLVAALGTGARNGVLIKGGVFIEELAKVRVVALDKTGTITRGAPEVTDVVPMPGATVSPDEALAITAGVESRSQHPLARAIAAHAEIRGVRQEDAVNFRAITGAGATAEVRGAPVYVGSPTFFEQQLGIRLSAVADEVGRLQGDGKTVILVGNDKEAWALYAIRDNVRLNAAHAIRMLRAAGVQHVVMLTGDNERTARAIAREVGIDELWAQLRPEEKAVKIRELIARFGHVAMVGDGVNDAPALAEATVGVAMGAAGTDVALETADVALMGDDLEKLAYALELARRNARVVRQNLVLSVLVIGVLVVGAVLGRFTLPIAVIGHELSEFVVIGSGLRMLRT